MMSPVFKKPLFVSLLSHITVFTIFTLSFGRVIPLADYAKASFWGQCLSSSQVNVPLPITFKPRPPLAGKADTSLLKKVTPGLTVEVRYYFKPQVSLALPPEKASFIAQTPPLLITAARREPEIILHPLLPYSFPLYFQDRQVAHVELAFKVVASGNRSSLVLKRKISSGNLEVDLLSTRYISHYLFIRQLAFAPDDWRTVKIDLSANND